MDLQGLPKSLKKAIEDMERALAKVARGESCLSWDCYFCKFQSSINSAEVNGVISSEVEHPTVAYQTSYNFGNSWA